MANIIKHVGLYGEKKCVVLFREVPNEPENCLIVLPAVLESRQHDEFMAIIEGVEAQSMNELADLLNRRRFSDGTNMLTTLHNEGRIQKVPTVNVDLTPVPNQRISLAEVNEELRKIAAGNPPPKTDGSHNQDVAEKPWVERTAEEATAMNQNAQAQAQSDSPENNADRAQSLLKQAELIRGDADALLADAEAKLAEAYALDPSLKPKKRGRPAKEKAQK
jgi:hypothetical protein